MTETTTFYLHGLPGSEAELNFAMPDWRAKGIKPLDRLTIRDTHEQALDAIASQIANYESAHLIGFSLGGMSALKLAARLPETVVKLDLIAPAAPLELGDFLEQMAGKPIFEAAMKSGGALGRIATAQRTLARVSKGAVIKAMFKGAAKTDTNLLRDAVMQAMLRDGLQKSLIDATEAYKSELRAFVTPWADTLARVPCPVTVWHGTADTWAPFGLSEALVERLGETAVLKPLEGLAHYSGLRAAMDQIAI
jgi:pimeloyl-ACP methyl ester carboxylesterase